MGNGKFKWEEKVVSVPLESVQLRFFSDERMWASVAVRQLNMEGKNILFVYIFCFRFTKRA